MLAATIRKQKWIEAHQSSYQVDTGHGIREVTVDPVLEIDEDGIELRRAK
jgi:hypothetical protein